MREVNITVKEMLSGFSALTSLSMKELNEEQTDLSMDLAILLDDMDRQREAYVKARKGLIKVVGYEDDPEDRQAMLRQAQAHAQNDVEVIDLTKEREKRDKWEIGIEKLESKKIVLTVPDFTRQDVKDAKIKTRPAELRGLRWLFSDSVTKDIPVKKTTTKKRRR